MITDPNTVPDHGNYPMGKHLPMVKHVGPTMDLTVYETWSAEEVVFKNVPGETLEEAIKNLCENRCWHHVPIQYPEYPDHPEPMYTDHWAVDERAYKARYGTLDGIAQNLEALKAGELDEFHGLLSIYQTHSVDFSHLKPWPRD